MFLKSDYPIMAANRALLAEAAQKQADRYREQAMRGGVDYSWAIAVAERYEDEAQQYRDEANYYLSLSPEGKAITSEDSVPQT